MPALRNDIDPEGLLEYSVVFTDRSLNHMSEEFQTVMRDISVKLKEVYSASAVALIPGGGSYAMEAVARQFAQDMPVMVLRNGWFSYRWSQIFDATGLPSDATVLMGRRMGNQADAPYAPPALEEVVQRIQTDRPAVVFAPHVETSAGLILPDDYLIEVARAVHSYGGIFVLDCVASGCVWVDMAHTGVDVLISAPQKGWSASPSAGCVMLSDHALSRIENTQSNSFVVDLKKWLSIMQAYENGGHAYHTTMPTDGLRGFRDAILETQEFGFDNAKAAQWELGRRVRGALQARGIRSVAAEAYGAPGVVVSYTDRADIKSGAAFAAQGIQIAAGVPLQVGEGEAFSSFRIGLFGLDKLRDIDGCVSRLETALDRVFDGA